MKTSALKQWSISLMAITLTAAACNQANKPRLIIENTGVANPGKLIIVKRSAFQGKIDSLPPGKYIQLQDAGTPLVLQYDDFDGDGNWDEIAFLLSLGAKEKKTLDITVADAPAAIKAVVRAHVRQKHKNADNTFGSDLAIDSIPAGQPATDFSKVPYPPFLTEGPAWENDKVGFRIYFDVRNGKDIWGKTTSRMVLDEVGADTARNYHALSDWGMDILKVGKSLGAGSLALAIKTKAGKDTLVRLGNRNMGPVAYRRIADGPVRAIFRLQYPAWKIADSLAPVSLTEEIGIWGGQYFYESNITLSGAPDGAKLVTGLINFYDTELKSIDTSVYKIAYTWGQQSENKDNLGLAVLAGSEMFDSTFTTPNANSDILNTYGVALKTNVQPVFFRYYVGWQHSDAQFATEAAFREFLVQETKRNAPVFITVE